MELTLKKYARLAALGALAVSAGAIGLYLLLWWVARPVPTGGIDDTQATLAWISIAIPIALVVAIHVAYALVLFRYGRDAGGA
jgi:hypothetical protein